MKKVKNDYDNHKARKRDVKIKHYDQVLARYYLIINLSCQTENVIDAFDIYIYLIIASYRLFIIQWYIL